MKRPTRRPRGISHERIVNAGARAIRRQGYDGLSIIGVMKEAGLTHGSFYAHFASRDALLAELSERAGAQSITAYAQAAAQAPPEDALRVLLRTYLSDAHVRQPEVGCTIAALGAETPRQAPPVRQAVTRHIQDVIQLLKRHAADSAQAGAYDRALVTTATLVGTIVLARAVDEPVLSEAVLRAARVHLGAVQDLVPPPTPIEPQPTLETHS